MLFSNLFNPKTFSLFLNHNVTRFAIAFLVFISFIITYLTSLVHGVFVVLAFPLGAIACNVLLTSKALEQLSLLKVPKNLSSFKVETNFTCGVCGDSQCKRQRDFKKNQPWLGLNISKDLDQAIQDLLNKILNEFVTSWHSNFTKDESFINELRRCLRYASSILLRRLIKVDIGTVIVDQLLSIGLQHVHDFQQILKLSAAENYKIEEAFVKYLNKRLHSAVHSRKSEIDYLRHLSKLLMDHLVQESQLQCLSFNVLIKELLAGWVLLPLTDTLCDPFCVNSLILLALNYDPLTYYPDNSSEQVQFLHKFAVINKDSQGKKSVLHLNLAEILKNQKYLYVFMQFLKREGVVHFLQFCLHVEEFSKKILNPELNSIERNSLYQEAWDLFSVYFKNDSPDSIHFPHHIVDQMKQILDKGSSEIGKLANNPVLFEAYDVAYANLEETYCSLFYLSDEYFRLLCGEKQLPKSAKVTVSSSSELPASPTKMRGGKKTSETSVVGKISSKFNKLLQFQAVEGRAYFNDSALDLSEAECADVLEVEAISENAQRDMSTWKVTVPYVTTKQDPNSKPYPVFNINVSIIVKETDKLDIQNSSVKSKWNVERRFNDFYLLQAKLAEFHGDFEDGTQLPPKTGMFSPRGSEFLENRRRLFEEYLQKLITKPSLRGSDLLYFFLHSPVEFSSCLSAQYGIGRILRKSVEPIKLRKERGQKLENFLNVFMASIEASKKSGKYEWKDVNAESSRMKRDLTQSIFNNNFEQFLSKTDSEKESVVQQQEILNLIGVWDCILYIMSKLLGTPFSLIRGVVAVKEILGDSSDQFIKMLFKTKLDSLLVSARISHLIRLLQDALFNSNYKPGNQGHKALKERITKEVKAASNNFLFYWLFPNFNHGIEVIVDSLQFPLLNKHLCYCLLDEIVKILFPEIGT